MLKLFSSCRCSLKLLSSGWAWSTLARYITIRSPSQLIRVLCRYRDRCRQANYLLSFYFIPRDQNQITCDWVQLGDTSLNVSPTGHWWWLSTALLNVFRQIATVWGINKKKKGFYFGASSLRSRGIGQWKTTFAAHTRKVRAGPSRLDFSGCLVIFKTLLTLCGRKTQAAEISDFVFLESFFLTT